MPAQPAPDSFFVDLHSIAFAGEPSPPDVVTIAEGDGFFLNTAVANDFRIRSQVYEMMKDAQKHLPANCHFMVFEAYRPLARQKMLWERTMGMLKRKYPGLGDKELRGLTETFTADPHNGIGSGHQACCAIDISLCDAGRREYDMGTAMHEFNEFTKTETPGLGAGVRSNRVILAGALEKAGLINYPAEWWHYSYGDHQWACLAGRLAALFGPIDI
jgi:zinc D-Ala-D-Ala dipeptidase